MDEYLCFENTFFVQAIVIFLNFLLTSLIFSLFYKCFQFFVNLITYLQLSIPHYIVNKIPTP